MICLLSSTYIFGQSDDSEDYIYNPGPVPGYEAGAYTYGQFDINPVSGAQFERDGFIYLADPEQGLLKFIGDGVSQLTYKADGKPQSLPPLSCFHLASDGWFHAIDSSGAYLHFTDGGILERMEDPRVAQAQSILEDAEGTIWFFSDTLYYLKRGNIYSSGMVPGDFSQHVVLSDSIAFFYTDNYDPWDFDDPPVEAKIVRIDLLKHSFEQFDFDRALTLGSFVALDAATILYVDYQDEHMCSLDLHSGKKSRFIKGLLDPFSAELISNSKGNIYLLIPGDGVYRIGMEGDPELGKIADERVYGKWMLVDAYDQVWAFSDKRILLSRGVKGKEKPYPVESLMNLFQLGDKVIPLADCSSRKRITTSYDQNELDIEIVSGDFAAPGYRSRYFIEGVNQDWNTDIGLTWGYYRSLPPGAYTLQYQSEEAKGKWGLVSSIDFRVRKPWWKSTVALISYVLSILLLFISIIRIRERFLRHEKVRLEQLVDERTEEIRNHLEEIESQRDEIEAQRDLLHDQNSVILQQKQDLTDSIDYAVRIQESLLPDNGSLKELIPEHFVLFMPKDVVSGDFYWFAQVGDAVIIVGADCTGHGVPGALISMLGLTYLDEIVKTNGILSPASILDELRARIINALQQEGRANEVRDGMDVVALTLYPARQELFFAGAKNPLYVVAGEEIVVHKGNRFAVSFSDEILPFTEHHISLDKGSMVYLFSDGFPDQFGGPNNKKYKYKPFREFLYSINREPTDVQHRKLRQELDEWIGDNPQIDDILVMGIRV